MSLKTSDKRVADYELAKFKVKLYAEFAQIRGDVFDFELKPIIENQPEINTTPTVSNIANSSIVPINAGPTIEKLIEYWSSQSEKRPKTILEAHIARKRLFKITGLKYANQVEKKDIIKFKDELIADGLSPATIEKQLNILKAIFSLAVSNELIDKNPLIGVKLVKQKGLPKPRVPFSSEDIATIFNSPIFSKCERPVGGAGEACVWLPYIALWTGMRLEEIGQLLVSDIKCHNDIYFINVGDDEFSTKRLKTSSSHRRIPIHPELIRLGLLDYVQMLKEGQSDRLFPKLVENVNNQYTAAFSKWFGRYLRGTIGITDKRKTFHSFRHGFKEACRVAEIPKDLHDKLTGHMSSDVGDGYGGDLYPLMPLYTAIKKIEFHLNQ
jgi:integrase